jgi:hypothetical protein
MGERPQGQGGNRPGGQGMGPGGFGGPGGPGGFGGQGAGQGGARRGFDPNDPEAMKRMVERMQQMEPAQREQFLARMKERGTDVSAMTKALGGASAGRGAAAATPSTVDAAAASGLTTIDALFGPLQVRTTRGRAWIWLSGQKQLKAVQVRLGITDGQYYELLEGDLKDGTELVTTITLADAARTGTGTQSGNPMMQRGGMPGMGGGPPGMGGRGR